MLRIVPRRPLHSYCDRNAAVAAGSSGLACSAEVEYTEQRYVNLVFTIPSRRLANARDVFSAVNARWKCLPDKGKHIQHFVDESWLVGRTTQCHFQCRCYDTMSLSLLCTKDHSLLPCLCLSLAHEQLHLRHLDYSGNSQPVEKITTRTSGLTAETTQQLTLLLLTMRPETSTPTAPSPRLRGLQKQLRHFTRELTETQTRYRDFAFRYHTLPLRVRTLFASDPVSVVCVQELTIRPNISSDPQTIIHIQNLREHKDKITGTLRSPAASTYNPEEMQAALNLAGSALTISANILDVVEDMLLTLGAAVLLHEQTEDFFLTTSDEPFDDQGLPTEEAPLGEKYGMFRAFILRLPEARRMLEVLGESERSVMSLCTVTEGEDRLILDEIKSDSEGEGEGED